MSGADKTTSVVVSTLREAWELYKAGLVADGTVDDVSDLCLRRNTYLDVTRSYTACQLP